MIDSGRSIEASRRPVIAITGGSSGIGLAIATRFFLEDWNVLICGRDPLRLQSAIDSMVNEKLTSTDHGSVTQESLKTTVTPTDPPVVEHRSILRNGDPRIAGVAVAVDISQPTSIERFVEISDQSFGRVDVFVNNAGVAPLGEIDQLSDATFQETIAVNCMPIFQATRALWPIFVRQSSGVLINISSMASTDPFPGFSLYGASKAWVNLFTRATANEGVKKGIRAYAICPGAVETPLLRDLFPDFPQAETLSPARVADLAWRLTQPEATSLNGQAIEIQQ